MHCPRLPAVVAIAALVVVLVGAQDVTFANDPVIDAQLQSIAAAESIIAEKVSERRADLRQTLAVARRLVRRQRGNAWADGDRLQYRPWARGWLRRLVRIKRRELVALEAELEAVRAHRRELSRDQQLEAVSPKSLKRPVAGGIVRSFGKYRHRGSGARLFRHGIELRSNAGESVVAPAAGVVRYVGPIRGLGVGAIVGTDAGWLVVFGRVAVDPGLLGARLEPGQAVGTATSKAVYLEVRVGAGGTTTIDPRPLLRP